MGRRPSSSNAIPRLRVRRRKKGKVYYFYDHGGRPRKETALGSDYALAIKRWAEIEHASYSRFAAVITFRYVADRYRAEIIPQKAPRTQIDNTAELAKLIAFFDDPPCQLDAIEPIHVRQYMTWRGDTAKTRATREKALLSHIWNFARDKGYTARENPCAGIKGYKSPGREVYIDDEEFARLREHADDVLLDAMDLAYLTGQRPSDVLRMDATKIRDGRIEVKQGKTGHKLRIAITGELATVIERIMSRKRSMQICSTRLVTNANGRPLRLGAIQARFRIARTAAGLPNVQFRDLRAKAGTDKTDAVGDIRQAQQQLGHSSVVMTEHYVRNRRGAKVTPTR